MTGSRVNAWLSALALFVATGPAQAADPGASAPPRGLAPPAQTEPAPPPATSGQTTPAEAATPKNGTDAWQSPAEQVVPDKPGTASGPRVTVSGLSSLDPSAAGLVSAGSGGFNSNLWVGSPRTAVVSRLAQLPSAPNSPAMQSILRRLLLTAATPPEGNTPPAEPSMLALRTQKLLSNGLIGEAEALASRSPRDDGFTRQVWAESLLLQGRDGDACGDATTLRQSANDPYWLKLRVLCYILQNDSSAATLTLDVMRERAVADDAFYTLATASLEGGKAQLAALQSPTGVHLALLRKANVPPPATLASWVPATNLLSQQSGDPTLRLTAAERATAAGLLPADQLRTVYDAETFTPDEIDDPDEAAKKLPPARANALYYQSIAERSIPAARAAAFAAGLQRAEAQNRFALFAELTGPVALQIKPSPQTAWLAPYILRVLFYAGHDRPAEAWQSVMNAPTDGATLNAFQLHAGLVRPSPENLARMQGAMTWLGQNALQPSPAKDWLMERATREIPLLEALGYIVPPDAQWAVSGTTAGIAPAGASAEALAAISRTAQEGKLGETLLNALIALGQGGPTRAQGQTVARVVKALMAVGLRDEARAIAIEAVLGAPVRLKK